MYVPVSEGLMRGIRGRLKRGDIKLEFLLIEDGVDGGEEC